MFVNLKKLKIGSHSELLQLRNICVITIFAQFLVICFGVIIVLYNNNSAF
jgi:hypothetical protein